jgi:putative transposase
MNERRNTPGQSVWQRSFHDHIIRSEKECNILREYMLTNPARWQTDMFYSSGE